MRKYKLLLTVLLGMFPFLLFGQSSGKLVGIVTDQTTGEALPGVNVFLEGTTLGAASDVDGYYVILNVPVGLYNVRANYVGYQDVVLSGIRITANKTTEANFVLEESAVEGQAVVITAERPLVEKYTTQSVSLVTSEELENIPVRGFNNVIAIQNSVVYQDGNIHIRGSRPDEVGFYVDGAASTDLLLNNTQAIHIIQEAVEEFQVLAGGYTAEFGGANAGIIRTELKTGGRDYRFSVDFQTDKFADAGEKFLGTYSYRHHTAVATLSGPLFSDKIRFFVAAENAYQGDRSMRFSEGFTLENLVDSNLDNPEVVAGHPDTIATYNYPSGFTPQRESEQWAIQSTLSFDLAPVQLRFSASFNDLQQQRNSFRTPDIGGRPDTPMLNVLNDRTFDDVFRNVLLSSKLTYVLSPKSILDGTFSYFNSVIDREDSYFGNDWQKWFDSTAVAQQTGGDVTYKSRWKPKEDYLFNGWFFARNGDPYRLYRRYDQQYMGGTLNFTTQANRYHELKIGGDFRRYTMRRFQINANAMDLLSVNQVDDIRDVPISQWTSTAVPINYGYNIYGEQIDNDQVRNDIQIGDAPKHPLFGSFYLQDKIEYKDLIINAGLRYDYFDSQGERFRDLENPSYDANTSTFTDDNWVEVDPFQQISPRLGFSFPVSERTVFYMQYGKFIQMPDLQANYSSSQRYAYEYISAGFSFQNPSGFGLDPVRTTSYEIGFRQQLSQVAAFDITGFYRNVRGQIQVDRVFPDPASGLSPFNILVNGDFATTKGLEFGLTLRRINRLQGQLNYTLTQAEGTGSTRTTGVAAIEQQTARPTVINPLDFEQTHRGSIILDYRFGRNDGGPVLQNLGANMLFTFNSGHPFTFSLSEVGQSNSYDAGVDYMLDPRARRALEGVNSSTTPFNYNFDLRLDKTFQLLKDLQATVYMRVNNLFNTRNVINVYNASGNAEDDGFIFNKDEDQRQSYLQAYGEDWLRQYELINIRNGQAYWDKLALELYGNPRQIFFGLKLTY